MGKIFERSLPALISLFGVYWLINNFVEKGREITAPITKPVSKALAEIQFFVNGSNYITRAWAGFYLEQSKLDYTLKVADMQWLYAITKLNDGNEALLNEIFDSDLRLKSQYRPLLNGLVDADTIAAAAKG
ncbi:hypothetical protein FHG08_11505 [Pseudoalteromonas sp. Scap03]|uniref:hypothetical protein n=1 Tax=unclassified Pseudoalteromonas TaxID=194690 RepID=UPI0015BD642D|nr:MULTISPECIES: hypothetical protein [unclassified Pseudoalteromonas]NWL16317.1 hypothetical protein [Pseudoalteromonas sp. Scap03]QLE81435.1 hypothetical protein FLM54_07760 [Pseudoalteromonas sp. Scap25]QLE89379.1 hypothetical protein FLM47_07755 [Pseudoalteromonas sp. Scap06]